ncbi:MAG: mannose-1-phosphate guanylyltransferase/mannose-6-phosphate isomerase [Alphaproteobacteria bacterium]|nr:mannose-1-phosphate guanylyltransferase/mannose-6-phosphate isomerase [Alphaproteobacteria bacterium]
MRDIVSKRLVHPVIMSGGSGSRLWPLSRRLLPKQLLSLSGKLTMIQETAMRLTGEEFAPAVVICNQEHRFLIAEQLREAGIENNEIVLEPFGRNTAPAAVIAALTVSQSDAQGIVLLLPSDHTIERVEDFRKAIAAAVPAAEAGKIVTFGIKPGTPETGYGYICAGDAVAGAPGCLRVQRFVEKPDRETAERYLANGNYYWNSGIFAFKASTLLGEMERLQPDIFSACKEALSGAHKDLDFVRLDEKAFKACPSLSLDYAVMEHTPHAAVVPVDMGWSDVGSWHALWDASEKGAEGNATKGDILAEDVRNSYLRSEGPLLAAVGVDDLVVVATTDAVLVAHRNAAQDVKKIVDQLESQGREHHIHHRKVYRPWGSYEGIDAGSRFQVKRIIVKPGAQLSLQMHHHRAEHWVVVEGTARVTCGDNEFLLHENESTFIPLGTRHRLENPGKVPLHLIEVQSGTYLGEDDIVRFEDTYGRTAQT